MAEFRMPSLGSDMEAGTLVAWLKAPGDRVAKGDVVAEVETDKGVIEVEAFAGGVIEKLLVAPGTKVPVGTVLAQLRDEGEATAAAPAPAAPAAPARASPLARRRAAELGVDVARLAGTGEGGAVTVSDVEAAAASRAAATPDEDAAARMRRAVAAAMSRSKREIPHFHVATTIDLGRAMQWLAATNAARAVPERILPAALLVKAVALALRDVPELNARWEGERAVASDRVHVGVAVALRGGGLVAPAVEDAHRLDVAALMSALADVVRRARSGALRSSEFAAGTFTVTNLGDRGVDAVLPVIFPPQVAMAGFGRIAERPWVVNGAVAARPLVQATLAADHRVTDGHRAAAFLVAVDERLQAPELL